MSNRYAFLSLIAAVAIAATNAVSPSEMHAQSPNPGEVVQAIARLNAAHLALAKKMASDLTFATAMKNAMNTGNHDAAAALASTATGIAKSNVQLSLRSAAPTGGAGDAGNVDAVSTLGERRSVVRLASLEPEASAGTWWNVCLTWGFGNTIFMAMLGCITWPWG
jgi:hypothetical protein